MATEFSTLYMKIDSTGAVTASKDLDRLTQTSKETEQATGKMAKATNQANESFRRQVQAVQALVAAFGLYKLARQIEDATLLAARYETLGIVMRTVGNNAGYTNAQMLSFAAGLEKTGISMNASRQALIQMVQAGLDLTKSQQLARIAQDAAVIGNMNSSEAFKQMIYGIQSAQPEILRTIGINVNFEQAYAKTAKTLGITTAQLDESQKATIRLNTAMSAGEQSAETYEAAMTTAAKQLFTLERHIENLRVLLGAAFTPALAEIVSQITTAITGINDNLKGEGREAIEKWGNSFRLTIIDIEAELLRLAQLIDKTGLAISLIKDEFSPRQAVGRWFGGNDYVYTSDTSQNIANRILENEDEQLRLAVHRNELEATYTDKFLEGQKKKLDAIEKEKLAKLQLEKDMEHYQSIIEYTAELEKRTTNEYYLMIGRLTEELKKQAKAQEEVNEQLKETERSQRLIEIERKRLREEYERNAELEARGFLPESSMTGTATATEETSRNLKDMARGIQDLGSGLASLNSTIGRTIYGVGNLITQMENYNGSVGSTFSLSGGLFSIGQAIGEFLGSRTGMGDWQPLQYDRGEYGAFTQTVKSTMTMLKVFDRQLQLTFGKEHLGIVQDNLRALDQDLTSLRIFASRTSGETRLNLEEKIWELEDRRIQLMKEEKQILEGNLRSAFGAEKQRLTDLYAAEMIVLNERLSTTQQIIMDLAAGVNKLQAAKERMFPTTVTDAQARIADALTKARRGDFSGLTGIDNALNAVTGMSTAGYSSSVDYQRDMLKNYRMISDLESLTSGQLSIEERSLSALEQLVVDSEKRYTDEMDRMDAQLNALLGIDTSVMSLADAIRQWIEYSGTVAPPSSGTPSGFTGGYNPDWTSTGGATGTPGIDEEPYYGAPGGRVPGGITSAYINQLLRDMSPDEVRDYLMNMYGTTFGFASGGYHSGGLRIVGERGPELEFTGPSRIVSNADSKKLLDTSGMEQEIRSLKQEMKSLRQEFKELLYIHRRWDGDGIPEERTVV